MIRFYYQAIIVVTGISYFIWVNVNSSEILYHFIDRYKPDRGVVFELCLKVSLGVSSGSTKKVKHFGFFGREVVFINTELSSDLDSPVLKGRVYPV